MLVQPEERKEAAERGWPRRPLLDQQAVWARVTFRGSISKVALFAASVVDQLESSVALPSPSPCASRTNTACPSCVHSTASRVTEGVESYRGCVRAASCARASQARSRASSLPQLAAPRELGRTTTRQDLANSKTWFWPLHPGRILRTCSFVGAVDEDGIQLDCFGGGHILKVGLIGLIGEHHEVAPIRYGANVPAGGIERIAPKSVCCI